MVALYATVREVCLAIIQEDAPHRQAQIELDAAIADCGRAVLDGDSTARNSRLDLSPLANHEAIENRGLVRTISGYHVEAVAGEGRTPGSVAVDVTGVREVAAEHRSVVRRVRHALVAQGFLASKPAVNAHSVTQLKGC